MTVTANLLFQWIVSHSLATSYVGLTRADSFFLRRPNSTKWTGEGESPNPVTDDQKAISLMTATRAIEAYPGISNNHFINYDENQRLYYPYEDVKTVTGAVDSATTTTITDSSLADVKGMPNDIWNYGSIKLIDGTGIGEIFEISDFDSVTGTVTINGTFAATPDTTTEYQLIAKIPDKIIEACYEIAYGYMPDLTTGVIIDTDQRQELIAKGVEQFRIDDHMEKFASGALSMVRGFVIPSTAVAILDGQITWFA